MRERRLTNKQEWAYANSKGICPKCGIQMRIVASKYIDMGSEYTFSCPDHGYFSVSITLHLKTLTPITNEDKK